MSILITCQIKYLLYNVFLLKINFITVSSRKRLKLTFGLGFVLNAVANADQVETPARPFEKMRNKYISSRQFEYKRQIKLLLMDNLIIAKQSQMNYININ